MSRPFVVFRIHVVRGGQRFVESEFTDLEAAAQHVAWLMRHDPRARITLDVIPPVGPVPRAPTVTGRTPAPPPMQAYRYPGQPRALSEMALWTSWERERGHTGEPNPFETLVQKRSQAHHDVVERACEEALQGGEYGVRVDVYPTRTVAYVDPTVPYGHSVEHQHLTDPQEPR